MGIGWKRKAGLILGVGLLLTYLLSRLFKITLIPLFTDEAIYLRWSQIMASDLKFIYLPLTDGKPPLFMWLTAVAMRGLPLWDPVLVGRLVSVAAGLFGLAGVYFASWQLFRSRRVGLFSVLIYLVSPFALFYDRFATSDSLLAALSVWSLGFGVLLVRTGRVREAVVLGMTIGLGMLTKSPAQLFVVLLPVLFLVFDFTPRALGGRLLRLVALFGLSALIARVIYMGLRFLPMGYSINLKNGEFVVPFGQWVNNPLEFFRGNLWALSYWEYSYLTVGLVLLIVLALLRRAYFREKAVLFLYFSIPFLLMCLFNKVIYPRFLLTFTPMLFILAGAGLSDLLGLVRNRWMFAGVLTLALLPGAVVDYKLYADPVQAKIADNDSRQYLNSWSAGFGLSEVRQFLAGEAKKYRRVTVGMEGTFGLLPFGLELYQREYPNLEIKSYWPPSDQLPAEVINSSKDHPTYYIIYQREPKELNPRLHLVRKYQEGISNDYFKLYRVQ